jgi:hypothetical protein
MLQRNNRTSDLRIFMNLSGVNLVSSFAVDRATVFALWGAVRCFRFMVI